MLNLTNTASILKKSILPIGVVLIITILVILIALQFFSRKFESKVQSTGKIESPKIEKLPITTSHFNTQNLKLPPNSPQVLKTYRPLPADFLKNSDALANKLNFNQPPAQVEDTIVGTKLNYSQESKYLSVYKNGFSYSNFSQGYPKSGQFKPPEELKVDSISFLANMGLNAQFTENYQISYQVFNEQSEGFIETNDLKDADRIVINFIYEISGFKVVGKNITVYAVFNKQNLLTQFVYNQFLPGDEINQYPVITAQGALQDLIVGKGLLITEQGLDNLNSYPKQFNTVDLTSAYLAYYQSDKSNLLLQPIWVFEGKTASPGGDIILTYAVPAVDPKYLQNPSSP